MINFEYLDELYRCKVKAEIKLDELEDREDDPTPAGDNGLTIQKRRLEISNEKETVNRYNNLIRSYIATHN